MHKSKNNIIAISGCHGTGKTTIVYDIATNLKKKGKNCRILTELARECPFPINKTNDPRTQRWMISAQMKKELEVKDKYDVVIADRPIFDSIVYGIVNDIFTFEDYNYFVDHGIDVYKKIYLLDPHNFSYQIDDGIRDMDNDFRLKIHNTLYKFYEENCIDVVYVKSLEDIEELK